MSNIPVNGYRGESSPRLNKAKYIVWIHHSDGSWAPVPCYSNRHVYEVIAYWGAPYIVTGGIVEVPQKENQNE